MYKPIGLTPYGKRQAGVLAEDRGIASETGFEARWIRAVAAVVIALIVVFIVLHLGGHGLGSMHHR